jgi:non-specific serine/threonine protein kinase
VSQPQNNLPLQLSSFVGREREVAEVASLLSEHRLLTLTGPGGSGKTRLALAVASGLVERYEDGMWLVELAPLSDSDLVPQAVASVLGVREAPGTTFVDSLRAHLESRETLLILDNCEHLVEASASLAGALLPFCPNLKVLATSREALRTSGETLFVVPPLSLPDPRRPPAPDGLPSYEAARLFAERARAVRPDFEITGGNAMAVAQICYRLDGMPLAIELAAARVRVLSVEQISSRLEDSFALLAGSGKRTAPARQGTLRATMDWSYELLPEEERLLLRRVSVFAGGFALEAAEVVCAGGDLERGEVLELLASLVDKSLVLVSERDGEARYRLLETIRQYGLEKLEEGGEAGQMRGRHAAWFLSLAERAESELKGHQQVAWLARLEKEHDNLRVAMRWLLEEGETDSAVRIAWALWLFWRVHGYQGEGYRYTGEALEAGDALPTLVRAKALCVRGLMSYGIESIEGTERLWEQSAALFRQTKDTFGLALTMGGLSAMALAQGDLDRSTALFEETMELYKKIENKWGVGSVLSHQGVIPLSRGEHEQAARYFEEALAISREIGDKLIGSVSLHNLAWTSRLQGNYERAAGLYVEGLGVAVELGDKADVAYCLEGLASMIAEREEPARAARLFGASEALLEAIGAPLHVQAQDRALYERTVESLRCRLGEEAFGVAWAEGRAMTLEQVVEYALGTLASSERPASPTNAYPAGLSAREVEVLRLVAQGMTNAQIATELYISPRTVNAHLGSVYHKIGSSTRAEATRFASEYNLL